MDTLLLSTQSPLAIETAVEHLLRGHLIAFPTDTVYGVAALISLPEAVDRLYRVKERSPNKAIAALISDLEQVDLVAASLSERARRLARRFWPGALTLVVQRHPDLPANLSPDGTIGVRLPDYEFARQLLRRTGPLATTSANLSGGPNPRDAREVAEQLQGRIELILDGGLVPGGVPSTVVNCTTPDLVILREGAISAAQIFSEEVNF